MKFDKKSEKWHECMQHAFTEAADNIETWEYGGAESEEERLMTKEASFEVAKIIRSLAARRDRKFYKV